MLPGLSRKHATAAPALCVAIGCAVLGLLSFAAGATTAANSETARLFPVRMSMTGPSAAARGKPVEYIVRVTNNTSRTLSAVIINERYSTTATAFSYHEKFTIASLGPNATYTRRVVDSGPSKSASTKLLYSTYYLATIEGVPGMNGAFSSATITP